MPHPSPYKIDIPDVDILSFLFPADKPASNKPIWINAENPDHSLSPAQLLQWVRRLGAGLDALRIPQNEVVMMFSSNHIFVPVVYLGVAGSGRIFSGCNPAYGVDETAFQISNTGAKLILVEPPYLPIVLKAAAKHSFPLDRIFLFSDTPCQPNSSIQDWSTFLPTPSASSRWSWPHLPSSTVAVLNYSSGTTGLPKGVMITHGNIIANVLQSLYMRSLASATTTTPSPSPSPERWLGFSPLYHAFGQLWTISAAAYTHTPVYLMRSFALPSFLSHLQTHRITHLQTAPPVLVLLAKRPEVASHDLSSLRNILCGAAPLSADLQNAVSQKLNVKVVQTWGMTELTCSSCHVPGLMDDRTGSVGPADPNCLVKLLDEEGKEVGVGQPGEMHIRGPNVCAGYWRNEEATRGAFDEEGYLRTGDVGVRDERGWYWIVDRKKELIKVKGFQVAPAELEAVLLEHEGVDDVAVVGVEGGDGEEMPRAYVVRKDGTGVTEEEIRRWMDGKVAKHKRLEGGVKFVAEVPKSASGKIVRRTMREWAKRDARPKAKL
ncbi:4-coumarate-CoA ligase [Myriangium duriaei CBS 260.36]|uniref:4-coumarate-CoA ligase n=1 Tax=Myriangium duriaei CBS 260.36 TaxID=1168546 RepID=A0A9P4J5H1_9PEZI|nr:4-coumarate-CoA ligase [Myriangium duriaei CBS 260.36]